MPWYSLAETNLTLAALAAAVLIADSASGQVCWVQYEVFNKDRKVAGPVNKECGRPADTGSAPFGNWGVETETSPRKDGFQFAGWCHDSYVCDNDGHCWTACGDDWYE